MNTSKHESRKRQAVNLSPLILKALEVFKIEGLDVSASGLLRVMRCQELLSPSLLVHLMLPRDYDLPVSQFQRERVIEAISSVEEPT